MKKTYFKSIILFAMMSTLIGAVILRANQYIIWGIEESKIVIPVGSVITEAVLTITAVGPQNASLYVRLLDNTKAKYKMGIDTQGGDFFAPHGVLLRATYENGNYVCRFSQNNNPSPMRAIFPEPTSIKLGDSTTVLLSSALLELMDYIGNGKGIGIGIDPGDVTTMTFTGLKLDITIQSLLTADSTKLILSYDLTPPAGDVNQDMRVDLNDAAIFSQNWLASNCQLPDYCNGCDIDKSGRVDIADLSILVQNWLVGV
jgi:hypothetical protein